MRELLAAREQGHEDAALAFNLYCYRLKKYIGAYLAALGRVDAILFTGGIGENAAPVREQACQGLDGLGITVNRERNRQRNKGIIELQEVDAQIKVLVVPTDEEREIAMQTKTVVTLRHD